MSIAYCQMSNVLFFYPGYVRDSNTIWRYGMTHADAEDFVMCAAIERFDPFQ